MKARYEDLRTRKGSQSFLAYQFTVPKFLFHWHYHPEYELTLITTGKGKRMVGDSHEDFREPDLVLIGPQVPHTWVSARTEKGKQSATVIQFSEEFIESLTRFPECGHIRALLNQSEKGLRFSMNENNNLADSIKALVHKKGAERITGLLAVLDGLSKQKAIRLSSGTYRPARRKENNKRINKICQFIETETATASIRAAAALVHLSESAFCKFFKRQTGKTFSDYLNHVRISDACRQLGETDKPIADIAHEVGFESMTYFNRVFLKKKGMRPREYRQHTAYL